MTTKNLPSFTLLFLILFVSQTAFGTQYNTISDGAWNNPTTWSGGIVPSIPVAGNDTINIYHLVILSSNLEISPGGMVNVHQNNGILDMTGFGLFNQSNGGGIQYGGFNVFGQVMLSYIRNYAFSWIYVEPSGIMILNGDFDNLGDLYLSGIISMNNGNLNHRAGDIWIFAGGDLALSNGNFNNYSTIRNLFPSSCIRLLGGDFVNHRGASVTGSGGVTATGNIDNSQNAMGNWSGASWCAGGSGINVPAALEDCAGPCNSPLQVEMVDFDAVLEDNGEVRIFWSTQSEINSNHFIIEKTTDLEHFTQVELVQAAGQSTSLNSYETFDQDPGQGMVYYRISEVDQEGSLSIYGQLVTVFVEAESKPFALYPNPAQGMVNIQVDPAEVEGSEIMILDQLGAVVQQRRLESANAQISLEGLSTGIYFVALKKGSSLVSQRLMVN